MIEPTMINTTDAAQPGASYSQAYDLGNLVITAGQIGATPNGRLGTTLQQQVELGIDNLEAVLRAAGSTLDQVVKTTCFLADVADFAEFDRLYRARFGDRLPARSTIGASFGNPEILVEIEAIATK
ncbi:RidA family protein [Microlunatus soli]|uniref:2-iminobutanoate/2-iminopropanoate deaminase n=1 Tax=Microlunatus soli TaxID=630515 RepID=A0A1H1Y9X3_9ACTN|nr:RidA family protein [Microlunatus soli]SDT18164.1 2-iminobutanoate/2-iminopropanoate deaminase [Microlunatus soli]